jgi:hypothetical protein
LVGKVTVLLPLVKKPRPTHIEKFDGWMNAKASVMGIMERQTLEPNPKVLTQGRGATFQG